MAKPGDLLPRGTEKKKRNHERLSQINTQELTSVTIVCTSGDVSHLFLGYLGLIHSKEWVVVFFQLPMTHLLYPHILTTFQLRLTFNPSPHTEQKNRYVQPHHNLTASTITLKYQMKQRSDSKQKPRGSEVTQSSAALPGYPTGRKNGAGPTSWNKTRTIGEEPSADGAGGKRRTRPRSRRGLKGRTRGGREGAKHTVGALDKFSAIGSFDADQPPPTCDRIEGLAEGVRQRGGCSRHWAGRRARMPAAD
ncbi:hypothetical protein KM043_016128 [Ampulex compressa]|nr:hypothetical protein KM043_016128 [Ampulex compressa]